MKDKDFEKMMNEIEKIQGQFFKCVTGNFLRNKKNPNNKNIVEKLLENFKNLGCNMSVKMFFLHSYIDYVPKNLRHYRDEHGECFHQDIKEVKNRYWVKWNVNMMADYYWMLKRDINGERGSAIKSC